MSKIAVVNEWKRLHVARNLSIHFVAQSNSKAENGLGTIITIDWTVMCVACRRNVGGWGKP